MNPSKAFQLFQQALALHQGGKLDEAIAAYRKAIATDPKNSDAPRMLGLLYLQRGQWQEGARLTGVSLNLNPNQPEALNNRGYALQNLGKNEESLDCYDQALKLSPGYAGAWYNRGNLLQVMERYEDAVASYRQGLVLRPGHADSYVNMGNALKQTGRFEKALACYDQALRITPEHAVAHNNRGNTLKELKRYEEALSSFEKAIELDSSYTNALYNAALVLIDLKRYEEALAKLDANIIADPAAAKVFARKGVVLIELGRMSEAASNLNKAVDLDPNEAVALSGLLSLGHDAKDDHIFLKMKALYASRHSLPQVDQVFLNFSMGKALENHGEYDEAFAAYEEGNRLYSADHPYDEGSEIQFRQSTLGYFSKALFEKYASIQQQLPDFPDDRIPIFIVGMPRSGTTLIEQILSSHDSLFGAGELATLGDIAKQVELPPIDSPQWADSLRELRKLGQTYLDKVWQLAPEARYITDKMPHNFQYVGLIHLMLPNARIIHAARDPMDSCFSSYALKFKDGHDYCYNQETLGRHYVRYRQMMKHWHDVLQPGCMLDTCYEDVVADLEGQARRLLEYVGLPWDPACLKFYENKRAVSTASVTQVRKPIYSSSVARWKNFEKHLDPLMNIIRASN